MVFVNLVAGVVGAVLLQVDSTKLHHDFLQCTKMYSGRFAETCDAFVFLWRKKTYKLHCIFNNHLQRPASSAQKPLQCDLSVI